MNKIIILTSRCISISFVPYIISVLGNSHRTLVPPGPQARTADLPSSICPLVRTRLVSSGPAEVVWVLCSCLRHCRVSRACLPHSDPCIRRPSNPCQLFPLRALDLATSSQDQTSIRSGQIHQQVFEECGHGPAKGWTPLNLVRTVHPARMISGCDSFR